MNTSLHTRVDVAIRRACGFLTAGQEHDGFWRDYELPPGQSSAWVTAVVGYALFNAGSTLTPGGSLCRALLALRSGCRPAGWGYNAAVAPDADTTSWVIRWFVRTNSELPLQPVSCLEAYLVPEGGARTFVCGPRYGCWAIEHVDVTAVLALAMKEAGASACTLARLRQWLLTQRNSEGLWSSFWWTFDAYATARTLEFLARTGGIPPDVAEASRHYVARRTSFTSTMETANLMMMAARVGKRPQPWISLILDNQQSNGGWQPSRVLKIPSQRTASDDETVVEDLNGVMSTAMAVMALTTFAGRRRRDA